MVLYRILPILSTYVTKFCSLFFYQMLFLRLLQLMCFPKQYHAIWFDSCPRCYLDNVKTFCRLDHFCIFYNSMHISKKRLSDSENVSAQFGSSFAKIVSEYDQEIPQSQTADKPMALQGRATQLWKSLQLN